MIFLYQARLAILSQPKTGTTALDNALEGRASMAFKNPTSLKHMQYPKFMAFVAPLIRDVAGLEREEYDVVSVMREPIDWLGSWYRYRTRDVLRDARKEKKRSNYTGDMSFEDFVLEVLKGKGQRKTFAKVGNPCSVALSEDGAIGCDRIFPYEDLTELYDLIEMRTNKPLDIPKLNVSPPGDVSLSEETQQKLQAQWPFAFDLHRSLRPDGVVDARFRVPTAGADTTD